MRLHPHSCGRASEPSDRAAVEKQYKCASQSEAATLKGRVMKAKRAERKADAISIVSDQKSYITQGKRCDQAAAAAELDPQESFMKRTTDERTDFGRRN
jgi:hypothetical protein